MGTQASACNSERTRVLRTNELAISSLASESRQVNELKRPARRIGTEATPEVVEMFGQSRVALGKRSHHEEQIPLTGQRSNEAALNQ